MQKHVKSMLRTMENSLWQTNEAYLGEELRDKLKDVEPAEVKCNEQRIKDSILSDLKLERWVYIVCGAANGCYVSALFEHISKYSVVIVFECQMSHIKQAMSRYDFSEQLKAGRLIFITAAVKKEIYDKIQAVQELLNRSVCQCPLAPSYDIDQSYETENMLLDITEMQRDNLITMLMHSKYTFRNLIDNLPEYVKSAGVNMLKDRFKGKPGIMISAGPSIDKQLEDLLQVNMDTTSVMVSCLTMLKPLMDVPGECISPDFVTALDYHEVSAKFLDGQSLPFSAVYEPKVNGAVVAKSAELGGQFLFPADGLLNFLLGEFPDEVQRNDKDYMPSGSTVAHLSFALLEYMGCDPIIMVGQDLGFTADKYYPECVLTAHPWKKKEPIVIDPVSRASRWIKLADGQTIYQDAQMHGYLEIFERMWDRCTARVIDCTEGGYPKQNVDETIPLAEALKKYCTKPIDADLFEINPEKYNSTQLAKERIISRIKEVEEYLRANSAAMEVYAKVSDAKAAGKPEPEDTKAQVYQAFCRMKAYQQAKILIELWSGTAQTLRVWSQSDIVLSELKAEAEFDARWAEDLNYMEIIERAGDELLECLRKCLRRLK
ncbi:MAG: 6-hydroxymethylpterin diphosphokinase MptE-like protein [Planctomycetota bacterium]